MNQVTDAGSTTRTKKRTRDPEAKKRAVLEAALKELSKHGYAGARADRIALVADVSAGTVFKLFIDKRGLANAVFAECLTRIQARLAPILAGDHTAREAYELMYSAYVDLLVRDPDCLMVFDYQPTSDYLDPANSAGLRAFRQGLVKWIERHQEAGTLKAASTELLRAIVIGAIMRILRESVDGNVTITKGRLEQLKELLWTAIATPTRDAKPD